MRKIFSKIMVSALALLLLSTGQAEAGRYDSLTNTYVHEAKIVDFPVYVDGKRSRMEYYMLNVENINYLSLRDISRITKRYVQWNNEKKEISIGGKIDVSSLNYNGNKSNKKSISATEVDFQIYTENGRQDIKRPQLLVDGRTYLAVRDIAAMLDIDIYWDNSTKSLYIGEFDIEEIKTQEEKTEQEQEKSKQQNIQIGDAYAQEILRLTNEFRAENGLSALKLVPEKEVQDYVNLRAVEISDKFSHTRPDGSEFGDDASVKNIYHVGENIAAGNKLYTPKDAVEEWKNSPRHRANMLHAPYTHMYAGYYKNTSKAYENYHVQMFFFEK